jgi:hypothetical protein
MNNTNNTFFYKECLELLSENKSNDDPLLVVSLIINGLLILTTGISELMASSNCKFNSLFELIIYPCKNLKKEIKEEEEENVADV